MISRQLFDAESSTYTYLIADPKTREAVLIDPVLELVERDLKLAQELDLKLVHVFETHVHADHVTAAGVIRKRTGATVVASAAGASCADLHVKNGDEVRVGSLVFRVLETPGHTNDSVSFLLNDRVFTGDALMVRTNGRTDFQNGNPSELWDSITRVLFALPDDTLVYPAHDYRGFTVTSIGEEKAHHPRFAGKTRAEFIETMNALDLPKPRKLDIAVPANQSCGDPSLRTAPPSV